MSEKTKQEDTSAPRLALLLLPLLCPVPLSSCPLPPTATVDGSDLESAPLHPRAVLDNLSDEGLRQPGPWAKWLPEPQRASLESWEEEESLLRAARGELMARPLSPFPGAHSLDRTHYQDGGEGDDGGKRNEALTSIAGGLQAVNREKGGFGFRFGRKRWSGRGGRDERMRSTEEDERE